MLFLNGEEVFKSVKLKEVVNAIEKSMKLYEMGKFKMPTRMHMDYDDNTFLAMPCYAEERVGTKLLTLTPKNKEKDLPVIQGCFTLNDSKNGELLAFIEGSSLTALRTGAVGGVGIKHMTPENVDSVGIIGAGVQGLHQALYASEVRDIEDVYVFDIDQAQIKDFKDKLSDKKSNIKIHSSKSSEHLLKESDIVITTTTANEPVLPDNEDLLKGKHFVGIGSYKPEMREFPEALFKVLDDIFIDTEDALKESGDLIYPLEKGWINEKQIHTMGKLLNGKIKIDKEKTTFFKSVGMALFDLMASSLVYEKALERGIGQEIEF